MADRARRVCSRPATRSAGSRHRLSPILFPLRRLPAGTRIVGPWRGLGIADLLVDLTYSADGNAVVHEQQIFDRLFQLIEEAETFLVLDFFLLNDFATDDTHAHRALSSELVERLVARKRRTPQLPILLITDPINTVYGSEFHQGLMTLESEGVEVVGTDLGLLRDSNPLYSVFYRLAFQWLRNRRGGGSLPNPFLPGDTVTLRSWMSLLNFKANHRKVAIAEGAGGATRALVTSANPHDASSAHSNLGLVFSGEAARDLLQTELAVARFSGWTGLPSEWQSTDPQDSAESTDAIGDSEPRLRIVTEGGILEGLLESLGLARSGDSIDMAMFYFGHRRLLRTLCQAAQRGVRVRLVLDPNRDAFGIAKDGVPNRPAARELITRSDGQIEVRWYQTHGEQFHTKLTVVRTRQVTCVSLGSANLTRRNLDDLNLETNVELRLPPGSAISRALGDYFSRIWNNRDGTHTAPYSAFEDNSRWRYWKYRVMETTGLSTF